MRERLDALAGKVALVTGGAGGIGLGIARALAEFGVHVVVLDNDRQRIEALASGPGSPGVTAIAGDATDERDLAACFAEIAGRHGALDILVNNVGGSAGRQKPFLQTSQEDWESLYRHNLWHVLRAVQLAVPLMRKGRPDRSIINITSIEAFRAYPRSTLYATFKAAVTGLTRSLALELAADDIRVNAIAPESTDTEAYRTERWLPAAETARIGHWIPLGRFGTVDDTAGCALFLASGLSSWVTGSTVHVDGGALAATGWVRTPDGDWTHRPNISGTHWGRPRKPG